MDNHTTPRIYVDAVLTDRIQIALSPDHHHYLKNVLRRGSGDVVRLFNGRDGEWRGVMVQQKNGTMIDLVEQIRPQPRSPERRCVLFPPLKKDRLDFLIEKAVELGVTHLCPILTDHTDVRDLNTARVTAQIIEAAEQCERLDLPVLAPVAKRADVMAAWPVDQPLWAAIERTEAQRPIGVPVSGVSILVGPPGGWSAAERQILLAHPAVIPVSLGLNILRTETAVLALLARALEGLS
jgi:16S rRNA (uracil1498-N3)-methyltransferase